VRCSPKRRSRELLNRQEGRRRPTAIIRLGKGGGERRVEGPQARLPFGGGNGPKKGGGFGQIPKRAAVAIASGVGTPGTKTERSLRPRTVSSCGGGQNRNTKTLKIPSIRRKAKFEKTTTLWNIEFLIEGEL